MVRLKIVLISDWFSENMGYAENFLPKALASLGHEIHLITSTAQVYYNSPDYQKTYEPFLGPNINNVGIKKIDGYFLHRLPLIPKKTGMPGIEGLTKYLDGLDPQIVQTFSINSLSTVEAARYCAAKNKPLFTECHVHASVFRKKNIFKKNVLNLILKNNIFKLVLDIYQSRISKKSLKFVNKVTSVCYPIAPDVAKIAKNYFLATDDKIKVQSLGVDTDLFKIPDYVSNSEEKIKNKIKLGLEPDSLVCIYTGRFSYDKKPQSLARAVNYLQSKGENIQALFIGNGTNEEIKEISEAKGCFVHKFVPVNELPKYYWLADVGVWPSQESTSQLDAAACGLPLILSDRIEVKERINGNGLLYSEDDDIDLAQKIIQFKNEKMRQTMSAIGALKIQNSFSWKAIASSRTEDYIKALNK